MTRGKPQMTPLPLFLRRTWRMALCIIGAVVTLPVAFSTPPAKLDPVAAENGPKAPSKKLHPELSDPVLGDRAALVEWAWSPQYAKRFGLPVQADGLRDGPLWLVGIKILRTQSGAKDFQSYQCRLAGLIDNKAPMIMPPGENHIRHPSYHWLGGMPGHTFKDAKALSLKEFTPAQTTWYKRPRNKLEQERPERSITVDYLLFYRRYTPDLAYFELETGCGYFGDPQTLRSEVRFPTETFPPGENGQIIGKVFKPSALTFDLPDSLMRKMYPRIVDADDWGSCLERRTDKNYFLTTHAFQTRRFGKSCEPVNPVSTATNR